MAAILECLMVFLVVLVPSVITDHTDHKHEHIAGATSRFSGRRIVCIACLTQPASYSMLNFSALRYKLEEGGLKIPKITKSCVDTPVIMRPDFRDAEVEECMDAPDHPSACVKIKGTYQGEDFVYRSCWDKMWLMGRNFDQEKQNKCYEKLTFTGTSDTTMCFCDRDMCNRAAIWSVQFSIVASASILACFLLVT